MSTADLCTVFVRGLPPDVTRTELEDLFSDVGPVKKCSVIKEKSSSTDTATSSGLGFGFVRFTTISDAKLACGSIDGQVTERNGRRYKLIVEVADKGNKDDDGSAKENKRSPTNNTNTTTATTPTSDTNTATTLPTTTATDELLSTQKRTSRVILRNLSFYASIKQIRSAMSKYGTIVDINLPTVNLDVNSPSVKSRNENYKGKKNDGEGVEGATIAQHRGFAFVTYESMSSCNAAIKDCVDESLGGIVIKDRRVAVDFSVSKVKHGIIKGGSGVVAKAGGMVGESVVGGKEKEKNGDDKYDENDDNDENESDPDSDSNDDDSDSDSTTSSTSSSSPVTKKKQSLTNDVKSNCTVFLRNLPFDTTKDEIFALFKPYGRIDSIFLVTDPHTNVSKGTCFVKFCYSLACDRALEAGMADESAAFVGGNDAALFNPNSVNSGIVVNGRRILVDKAVDKNEANELKVERDEKGKAVKTIGKDKRNLYLKLEGYVNGDVKVFNALPRLDQEKRQRAAQEKTTKLRSPLFFINPTRLSIRNLDKSIDEAMLKKLVTKALVAGLKNNLVNKEDVQKQLIAQGLTTRDAMGENSVPEFTEKNIKKFVTSLYIDREINEVVAGKKTVEGSRGYGFVEFKHHVHGLAVLRELNNNAKYSKEWVMHGEKVSNMVRGGGGSGGGGEKSSKGGGNGSNTADFIGEGGKVLVPRLIIEFAVENKAKAKKQGEKKAVKQANYEKQRAENYELAKSSKGEKEEKGKVATVGRGKLQREKKRAARGEAGTDVGGEAGVNGEEEEKKNKKNKVEKGVKTHEVDGQIVVDVKQSNKTGQKKRNAEAVNDELKEEKGFDDLVNKYKKAFMGGADVEAGADDVARKVAEEGKKSDRRWFE